MNSDASHEVPPCYDVARRSYVRCKLCYAPAATTWCGGMCGCCAAEFRGSALSGMIDPEGGRARIEARRAIVLQAWRDERSAMIDRE